MERINKHQLFCMMMLFEIGSTTLFALGVKAKQDAWIAAIIGMLNGFVLIWTYIKLQLNFPNKNFVEIIIILLGKPLGIPLSLIYGYYFIESSVLNFSEFGFLITKTILRRAPIVVIIIAFMLIVTYYLFLGLEVIGRTSEIMLPIMLFFLFSVYLIAIISGLIDFKDLTPILGNGIQPVLKAVYPDLITVPFGESVLFLMYWRYINISEDICKTSFLVLGFVGFIVVCSTIIIISSLGINYADSAAIPLLSVIRIINIGDFITNLDAIAIVLIFLGGFYKALLNLLGGIIAISTVFKINTKRLIVPVVILTFFITIYSIPSIIFHRFIGWNVFAKNIHVIFQIIIPPLLLIICWLKNRINKTNDTNDLLRKGE